jgi:hypothetical protein
VFAPEAGEVLRDLHRPLAGGLPARQAGWRRMAVFYLLLNGIALPRLKGDTAELS